MGWVYNHRRAAIPVVFGKKTTHSTGPVKTRSQHSGKQPPDRPVCHEGWFWNVSTTTTTFIYTILVEEKKGGKETKYRKQNNGRFIVIYTFFQLANER